MDSLSLDESFSSATAGPSQPLFASTPKAPKVSRNKLSCPYCDKVYTVQYYFNRHIESHRPTVNNNQSAVNASQAVRLNDSDVSFSKLDDSVCSNNNKATFKVPALPTQKGKKTGQNVKKKRPKPKFVCTYCAKGYLCSRSYQSHVRLHAVQDAAARYPDKTKVMESVEAISVAALTATANAPCSGLQGTLFKQLIGFVVSISSGDGWRDFSTCICEELIRATLDKKCLLPSTLLSSLVSRVEDILCDRALCDDLMEKLNIPLSHSTFVQDLFILEYLLNLRKSVLSFISKTFCASRRRVNKPPPELDEDYKQVIYYIAGSIMRGYLRIAHRYKKSKSWQNIVKVLKLKVLQEKPQEEVLSDARWTLNVDRGGLLYISDQCQKFVVALTGVVFSSEKRDGSIDYEEVIKKVSNTEVSIMWDDMIADSLTECNSLNLMNDVIRCFCRTCCRGIIKRRLNFLKSKPVVGMPTRHEVATKKKK